MGIEGPTRSFDLEGKRPLQQFRKPVAEKT